MLISNEILIVLPLGETSVMSQRISLCVLGVIEVALTGRFMIPVFTPRYEALYSV